MTATYPSRPFPACDPARLLAVARLHGAAGWDDATVRYLDLACGSGGNALAVAARRPDAVVLGIDVDAAAIAVATELAGEAGLPARFELADLRAAEAEGGAFDVVLVHGLLSWVDEGVAAAALALAARAVAPGGVVAVSYHATPGFRMRQVARDAVAGVPDAAAAIARLQLAADLNQLGGAYGSVLAAEGARYAEYDPAVLELDELVDVRPYSAREIAAAAGIAGLHHVGEALPEQWWRWRLEPDAADRLRAGAGDDPVEREQLADAALGAGFKLTLFAREPPDAAHDQLGAALDLFALSGDAPDGGLSGALRRFAETVAAAQGPATVAAIGAAAGMESGVAAEAALRLAAAGRVVLTAAPPPMGEPWPRPTVHPLARAQAARGEHLTTLAHTHVPVSDPVVADLLPLLDGTRDEAAIGEAIRELCGRHGRADDAPRIAAGIDGHLRTLAGLGLLASPT